MNYTDEDVQAIVDTQVELKTKELQQRIDKAIEYNTIISKYAQEELGTDEVDEVLSILQCEEVKDNENNNA